MANELWDIGQADALLGKNIIDAATYEKAMGVPPKSGPTAPDAFDVAANLNTQAAPPPAGVPFKDTEQGKLSAQMGQQGAPITPVSLPSTQDSAIVLPGDKLPNMPSMSYDNMEFTLPFTMKQEAVAQGLKTAQAKAAEQSAYMNRMAQEDAAAIRRQQDEAQRLESWMADKNAKLQVKMDEVASQKVDPNRFWSNKTTGEKIMAGIALALGAAGSGGNRAAGIINKAIEDDISLQKYAIDEQRKSLAGEKSLVNEMYDVYKDKSAATAAARIAGLNNAQMVLSAMGAKYTGREAKANAMALSADIEAQKQKAMLEFNGQLNRMYNAQNLSNVQNPELLDENQRERYVPGFGVALTKDDAKVMKEYSSDYENAASGIRKLIDISNTPLKSVSREQIAKADSISRMVQASLRTQILGPGAVTDAERAMLEKIVADPTKIFSLDSSNRTRLETLLETLKTNRDNKASTFGLKSQEQSLGFVKK